MKATEKNISYEIKDNGYGMKAFVHLPEGDFTLTLKYHNGMNGRREWDVIGHYPKNYSITYGANGLSILERDETAFEVGQKINHKAFGAGTVIKVNGNAVVVDFKKVGQKPMMGTILRNFLK